MIQYDNAQIGEVVTHFVGNRLLEDGMTISKAPVSQTEELRFTLRKFLLSSFEIDESWHFTHETGLEFNVVWSLCRDIFRHPELLYDKSVDIAKYLYDQCNHNKIKGGELCMVYFTDVMLDGDTMDAIGIFKSEEKDTFLKVIDLGFTLNMEAEKGISTHKLDKGALIFNKDTDGGFVVKVVDNTNKVDALYWMTDFLGVASCRDEFTGEVFEDKEVAETLNRYKEQYEAKNDIEIEDHFGKFYKVYYEEESI